MAESSSTKVNLSGEDLKSIRQEAKLKSSSMAKILRDYALEYLALKDEAKLAKNGKLYEGSILHNLIASMEARLTRSINNTHAEMICLRDDMKLISSLLNHYISFSLSHMSAIDEDKPDIRRYRRFLASLRKNDGSKEIAHVEGWND